MMGDCAVVENPTVDEHCMIAELMLDQNKKFNLFEPRFAFLSYSTKGSAKSESIEKVQKGRLTELTSIYVKYHEEAEKDPSLDDEARHYFKLIEDGDKEANELFNLFKQITLE